MYFKVQREIEVKYNLLLNQAQPNTKIKTDFPINKMTR